MKMAGLLDQRGRIVSLWGNVMMGLGIFLASIGVLLFLAYCVFSLLKTTSPYVDVVGYLVVPSVTAIGVSLVIVGMLLKGWWWRRRRNGQGRRRFRFPKINLNNRRQRRVAKWVIGVAVVLMPVLGVSGYHGYHYTDSSQFCAQACHSVMHPQATTYEYSVHARVPCADCHVGSGASWFVKSKLAGTRQILAMLSGGFSRPIPTAISELRPSRETCEKCHWAEKFIGTQLKKIVRFAADENNTRREIDMLLKTGSGGDPTTGVADGIHKHMAFRDIKYVAIDDLLQEIPWVEYVTESGESLIYRSDGRPSSDPPPRGQERTLDCMDCHNRPGHKFRSPQESVDIYLSNGRIDATLPFIKREATKVLVQSYPDLQSAKGRIASSLNEFYRLAYPEIWKTRRAAVNRAIDQAREIYEHNIFPEMNVDWRTYPENIGHLTSPGCFRCHDGSHVNQFGRTLSHDCNTCHTFLNSVDQAGDSKIIQEGEFIHLYPLDGPHRGLRCDQCHSGGLSPLPSCTGCHQDAAEFRRGTLVAFESFDIGPDTMLDSVACEGCHDLSAPLAAANDTCLDCHEDDAGYFDGMFASWKRKTHELFLDAEARADAEAWEALQTLRRAGPHHNMEATRKILGHIITPPGAGDSSLVSRLEVPAVARGHDASGMLASDMP